jgi:Ran GTPase-activating protein (RanGAP) involved in mRNA processing and transport
VDTYREWKDQYAQRVESKRRDEDRRREDEELEQNLQGRARVDHARGIDVTLREGATHEHHDYTERERFFGALRIQGQHKTAPGEQSRNPASKYLQSCTELKILPEPLIAKLQDAINKGEGVVNLQHYGMGDNTAKALASCMRQLPIVCLNLHSNRITKKGGHSLIASMDPDYLEELVLSNNEIGLRGMQSLVTLVNTASLHLLNLENNKLGDAAVSHLFQNLHSNRTLRELNLSKNNISARGAISFGAMIRVNKGLTKVCLGWNEFSGKAAAQLAAGFKENKSVQTLDLSWTNFSGLPAKEMGETLAVNKTLTHLDLSHCQLTGEDCTALSEGLNTNHSLMGLHMAGNKTQVDARGFLMEKGEGKDRAEEQEGHIFTRIIGKSNVKNADSWTAKGNCWICEQWRECKFVWNPGESDGRHSNIRHVKEGPKNVWLRTNFDQWEEEPMDKCTDGSFEIVRMAPPGQAMFCFVIDGQQGWSNSYKRAPLLLGGGAAGCEPKKGTPALPLTANLTNVAPRDEDDGITLKPRMRVPKPVEAIQQKLWLFKDSLFAPYVQDTDKQLARAFAADYMLTTVEKNMAQQPQQEEAVRTMLGKYYMIIKACFKQCCALSSSKDVYNVGWNSFTEFTNAAQILDQVRTSVCTSLCTLSALPSALCLHFPLHSVCTVHNRYALAHEYLLAQHVCACS